MRFTQNKRCPSGLIAQRCEVNPPAPTLVHIPPVSTRGSRSSGRRERLLRVDSSLLFKVLFVLLLQCFCEQVSLFPSFFGSFTSTMDPNFLWAFVFWCL
ncbi:unnamed protein product [Lota lota]